MSNVETTETNVKPALTTEILLNYIEEKNEKKLKLKREAYVETYPHDKAELARVEKHQKEFSLNVAKLAEQQWEEAYDKNNKLERFEVEAPYGVDKRTQITARAITAAKYIDRETGETRTTPGVRLVTKPVTATKTDLKKLAGLMKERIAK